MRAKVQIALGALEGHMLEYSVENIKKNKTEEEMAKEN